MKDILFVEGVLWRKSGWEVVGQRELTVVYRKKHVK